MKPAPAPSPWELAAEAIAVKIRWFGLLVGYAVVHLRSHAPENLAVLNVILSLGTLYTLLDTWYSLRGKVFLGRYPMSISLMESLFIGLLCYFHGGLESTFRYYYLLSLICCAIRYSAEVSAIERDGKGFRLRTSSGEVSAAKVVDAAGPYAQLIAAMVGVELPVEPVRRHIVMTGPCPALPPLIPMVIDADTGVLVRREGDRVLVAYSNADEPPGFNLRFDPEFPERIAEALMRRFPDVADAGIDRRRSWAGLYEVTPDHHAILGACAVPGFFLANGFSGHGIMNSPAAGRAVAELLLQGRSTSVDVAALSLDRFARGQAIHETMVL